MLLPSTVDPDLCANYTSILCGLGYISRISRRRQNKRQTNRQWFPLWTETAIRRSIYTKFSVVYCCRYVFFFNGIYHIFCLSRCRRFWFSSVALLLLLWLLLSIRNSYRLSVNCIRLWFIDTLQSIEKKKKSVRLKFSVCFCFWSAFDEITNVFDRCTFVCSKSFVRRGETTWELGLLSRPTNHLNPKYKSKLITRRSKFVQIGAFRVRSHE